MADETLLTRWEVDPAPGLKGLATGEAALKAFEQQVAQLARLMPTLDVQEFMAGVREGLQEVAANAQQAQRAVSPMAAAMAQANSGTEKFAQGLRTLAAQNVAASASFTASNRSVNLMRGGLTQLAVQATGASGAIGQVAQSILFMAGGSTAVIALAAAVGLLATAYNKLTKSANEAAAAQQKHIDALRTAIAADQDAAAADLAVANKRANDLRRQIRELDTDKIEGIQDPTRLGRLTEMRRELARLDIEVAQGNDLFVAGEKAKAAAVKVTTAALHEQAQAIRNTVRGNGNLTQGAGGTNTGPIRGGLLSGAGTGDITNSRAAAVIARNEAALSSLFATWSRGWKVVAADAAAAAREQDHIAGILHGVAQGLDAISSRNGIALLGEDATRTIGALSNLSDALGDVVKSASFGNIAGLVGAGVGVIGSLFGESATAREHAAIVSRNNERLLELKLSLDALNFDSPLAARTKEVFGVDLSGTHTGGQAELDAALARAGLTLEEFATSVERLTGIQILDSEGNLMGKAWRQAREGFERAAEEYRKAIDAEALKQAQERQAEALGRLREATLAAAAAMQQAADEFAQQIGNAIPGLLELRRTLGNMGKDMTDPANIVADLQQQFEDAVGALLGPITGTSGLQEMFQGIDLTDPASREALRKQVLEMVNNLLSGGAASLQDPSQFQPLLDFLGLTTDLLGQFDDAVGEATKSLLNVPHGVNLAALEFRAQAAGRSGGATSRVPGSQPSPFRGDGASLPVAQQYTITTGDIIIQGGTNVSPEQAAQRIKAELKRVSMAQFGTPDKWAQ